MTRLFEWARSIDFAEIEHDPRTPAPTHQCVGVHVVGRCHVRTTTKGHGRVEIRDCWTIADPRNRGDLRQGRQWKSLRSVAQSLP